MDEQARAADVVRVTTGDADALQRLLVHYHAALRRGLEKTISAPLRARIDADDILQQAYVVAFRTVGECQFAGPAAFYKWLEAIAGSRLRDEERAVRRQKRGPVHEAKRNSDSSASFPALLDRLTGHDPTPSRRLAQSEAVAAVMAGLASLSDEQRAVVQERFLRGRSVAEIAHELGKTEGAVHMLCHRGLKCLRTRMVSLTRYLSRL